MIKSMTGFGKAERHTAGKKISAEIRSLNSKQLDMTVKLPAAYRQAEYEVRNILSTGIQRGKVDVFITVEAPTAETSATINKAAFDAYTAQLSKFCSESPIIGTPDSRINAAIVEAALRLPDVVSTDAQTISDDEHKTLIEVVIEAASKLDSFRSQEGAILIADLLSRVDRIEAYKQAVTPYETRRTDAIRDRIRDSIAKLKIEVDSNRLEQEMIFYIEKLDITEEKVRLSNHCKYFREVASEEACAGRKLGFIAQEMGREINTMGSKANDSDIQILVVKMKDELEKIKEQVLNIL